MCAWGATPKPHFFGMCISNTPILGIQKHCCWHSWCAGMCAWDAAPKFHNFWHCAFQNPPHWASENTVAGIFVAEECTFGAPRQTLNFLGFVHFKHTHTRYPKALLVAYLVQRHAHLRRHANRPTIFAIAHFEESDNKYPKTLLMAHLVLTYAR